MPHSILH